MRHRLTLLVAGLAIAAAACSNSSDATTTTATDTPGSTTTTSESTTSSNLGSAQTATLTTADGLVDAVLDVVSCTAADESSITLAAANETGSLDIDATGLVGTIVYNDSGDVREGTVDFVIVSDGGGFSVEGGLNTVNGEPIRFTSEGQCG